MHDSMIWNAIQKRGFRFSYFWDFKRWPPILIHAPVYSIPLSAFRAMPNVPPNIRMPFLSSLIKSDREQIIHNNMQRTTSVVMSPAKGITQMSTMKVLSSASNNTVSTKDREEIVTPSTIKSIRYEIPEKFTKAHESLRRTQGVKDISKSGNVDIRRPLDRIILQPGSSHQMSVVDLILEPSATAIAGPLGMAIASPISRALLRQGYNARIHFRPTSVAIVGPGGVAHAESDLEIDYVDE